MFFWEAALRRLIVAVSGFVVVFIDGGEDVSFVAQELHSLPVRAQGEILIL